MARRRSLESGATRVALAAHGRAQGENEWYPRRDPAREVTAAGMAQVRAVREAELLVGADTWESRREMDVMRRIGAATSADRVRAAVEALDISLTPHGSLDKAAEAGARGYAQDDPRRAGKIVAAQWGLVQGAGHGAIVAARQVVVRTRAFSAMMVEWANAADVYRRDGSAAEAACAVEEGKFARRDDRQFGFTGMTVNQELRQHEENQVRMAIRRHAILSTVYPVEYYVFRARLSDDHEEIDSPKVAWNAHECEVRMPDGALVDPGGIRVVARMKWVDPEALGHLERLVRLGVGVGFHEGL